MTRVQRTFEVAQCLVFTVPQGHGPLLSPFPPLVLYFIVPKDTFAYFGICT